MRGLGVTITASSSPEIQSGLQVFRANGVEMALATLDDLDAVLHSATAGDGLRRGAMVAV